MIFEKDKLIVRELAKRYMEYVCSEKQNRMLQRMRNTNDLKLERPAVILDEIPWEQMDIDGELTLTCEDPSARKVESYFRRALFYFKHFEADNLYEPFFKVKRTVSIPLWIWAVFGWNGHWPANNLINIDTNGCRYFFQ